MGDGTVGGIVLDTHVWLWVVEGTQAELPTSAIQEITEASESGSILISAISVWEVAMLEAKGRVSLSQPLEEWSRAALRAPGTRLVGLTPEIAIESTRLPGAAHGDPTDRILVASARVLGARLATRDAHIIRYAKKGHVGFIDARP